MKVALKGGPADNSFTEIPDGLDPYLVPVLRSPVGAAAIFARSSDPLLDVNYDVAVYRFSQMGIVSIRGQVFALIYQYEGTQKR